MSSIHLLLFLPLLVSAHNDSCAIEVQELRDRLDQVEALMEDKLEEQAVQVVILTYCP